MNGAGKRPLALAVVLVLVAGVATLLRSWRPEVAALVAVGATGTYLALSYPYGPVFAFVVLSIYAVARHRRLRRSAPIALVSLLMLLVHVLTNDAAASGMVALLPPTAWIAIPFTLGVSRRMVVAASARERAATARQAIDAERLRLAQEVHDVVGHGLAAIQMQADIALHVEKQRPEQARQALYAISSASREALDELRETLRQVHSDGRPAAPTNLLPGLARVNKLCARVSDAGVHVELQETGARAPLPAASDLAAYRLLQEALSNVVKHSAHPHAQVRINQIRGLSALTEIRSLEALEFLSIYSEPRVQKLPDLSGLGRLARRELGSLKGLQGGIGPALRAPGLEELMLIRSVPVLAIREWNQPSRCGARAARRTQDLARAPCPRQLPKPLRSGDLGPTRLKRSTDSSDARGIRRGRRSRACALWLMQS